MPFNYKTDSRLLLRVDEDSPAFTDVAGTTAATTAGQLMSNVQDADGRGYTFTPKAGLAAPKWKVIGGKRVMTGVGSANFYGFGLTCPRAAISTGANSIEAVINAGRAATGSCTILVAYQLPTAAAMASGNQAMFSRGNHDSTSLWINSMRGANNNQIPPPEESPCQTIDYGSNQYDAIPYGRVLVAGITMNPAALSVVTSYKNGVPYVSPNRVPPADVTGNLNIGCCDNIGAFLGDILGVWIYGSASSTTAGLTDPEHFDAYQQILANFGQPDPWATATNKRVYFMNSFGVSTKVAGEHIRHLGMQAAPPAIYALSGISAAGMTGGFLQVAGPLINHLQALYGGVRVSIQEGTNDIATGQGSSSVVATKIAQDHRTLRASIRAACPGVGIDERSTPGRAYGGPTNARDTVANCEATRELFDPANAALCALDGAHYTDILVSPPLNDSARFSNTFAGDTVHVTRPGAQAMARAEAIGLNTAATGPTATAYTAAFEVAATNVGNRVRLLLQAVGVPASPITVTVTLSGSAASMASATAVLRSAEVVPMFIDPSAAGTASASFAHAGGGAGVTADPAAITLTVATGAASQVVIPEVDELLDTGPYLPFNTTVGQVVMIPVWLNGLATGTVTLAQSTVLGNFGGSPTKVLNYDGTVATVRQSVAFTPTSVGGLRFTSTNTIACQDLSNSGYVGVNAAPTKLYMFCANVGSGGASYPFEAAAGRPSGKIWLYLDAMAEGVVTLSDGGAGGTFSPGATVAVHYEPMNGQPSGIPVPATYTPAAGAAVGSTITISATCAVAGATIAAPPSLAVVVTAAPTTYTVAAPSPASGPAGTASAPWTITPSAGAATGYVMLSDAGCSPLAVCFNSSSAAQNFALTPAAGGTITVAGTNTAGLTNPAGVSYVAAFVAFVAQLLSTYRRRRSG